MAAILLAHVSPQGPHRGPPRDYTRLIDAAKHDRFGEHSLTGEADAADVILLSGGTGPDLRDVRRHPLVRRHREKCFLYHNGDRILPVIPGVYASIEKRWHLPSRTRSGYFLRVCDHGGIEAGPDIAACPYLASFLGAADNAPVRRKIMQIRSDRFLLRDTGVASPADAKEQRIRQYVDSLRQSKFILCPRGGGASSYRLFEALKARRIPVILSDPWVPPEGPDWESFSLRVPESRVGELPELLQAVEPQAEAMAEKALVAWNTWFAKDVAFHRLVGWCLSIQASRRLPERVLRHVTWFYMLHPYHFRHGVLGALKHGWKRVTGAV
jgi:hypothetical protein